MFVVLWHVFVHLPWCVTNRYLGIFSAIAIVSFGFE